MKKFQKIFQEIHLPPKKGEDQPEQRTNQSRQPPNPNLNQSPENNSIRKWCASTINKPSNPNTSRTT